MIGAHGVLAVLLQAEAGKFLSALLNQYRMAFAGEV
jgi:hypothetical protein